MHSINCILPIDPVFVSFDSKWILYIKNKKLLHQDLFFENKYFKVKHARFLVKTPLTVNFEIDFKVSFKTFDFEDSFKDATNLLNAHLNKLVCRYVSLDNIVY
jgi:hypothetical protein